MKVGIVWIQGLAPGFIHELKIRPPANDMKLKVLRRLNDWVARYAAVMVSCVTQTGKADGCLLLILVPTEIDLR
jgi:hypothetical protein